MNEELFLSSGLAVVRSNVVLFLYTWLIAPSKLNVVQFKNIIFRSCNMSCDFFARFTIWSANAI